MKSPELGVISRKLALLVMLAVLPALAILLYSGLEQRRQSITYAKNSIFQLTHSMATTQQEVTRSVRQILASLARMPAVQGMDQQAVQDIFAAVMAQNRNYGNITLTDINGNVLVSVRNTGKINLADRKHVKEALATRDFAVGEYIVTRGGAAIPAFAFAQPVLDGQGRPKAILTALIKLADIAKLHDLSDLPEKSFVAITDHKGIRLFYYPSQEATNPVGSPIKAASWQVASVATKPGIFVSSGSDGIRRIFAFEQVRLNRQASPYLYVWAGIPEDHILAPANRALLRNMLLFIAATAIALIISWVIGKNTEGLIRELEKALAEIKTLRGILPICSFCKNIRNDQGYYEQIESYIHKHSGVDFSHTICPDCMKKHYPRHYKRLHPDESD